MKTFILLIVIAVFSQNAVSQSTKEPIAVNTKYLQVSVDVINCRWSAKVIGSEMQINNVYFLPNNDPSGWKVVSSINQNDTSKLGSFVTVTLQGTKAGQLDFDYQLSVSKSGNDILVSLGRSNNTGNAVDIQDMDYFVSGDARLGGTTDRWVSLGTKSRAREYYELSAVFHLISPIMYEVNQVVRDKDTRNSLLMGHVTTVKGASRFTVAQGWQGKTADRMMVRGYCSYKVTMPAGKSFAGEKLLIKFSTDAIRAMEHQADLIAIVNDIDLKKKRPIDVDNPVILGNYIRYHGWMSGGSSANADNFFKTNGLNDFGWGQNTSRPVVVTPQPQASTAGVKPSTGGGGGGMGIRGLGSTVRDGLAKPLPPAEGFLQLSPPKYGGSRVIDFSNPLTIKLERERAFQNVVGRENSAGWTETDFSDMWDKWPGQSDPYMSAMETYHAGVAPWREVIDQKMPLRRNRANINAIDHSYGYIDICRISDDADGGYEEGDGYKFIFMTNSVLGGTIRAFYNGRVFWNDLDGFHIYRYKADYQTTGRFNSGQAKVSANFHAMVGSTLLVSEAFEPVRMDIQSYPTSRIELLKRISPLTMDVSYPVDLFVRRPAQVFNMPVERPFGKWDILSVFNYTNKLFSKEVMDQPWISWPPVTNMEEAYVFTTKLDAEKDLRLDPNKEYIVYEYWTKQLIGTFKGTFETRPLNPYDCDIYSIVEKKDYPVLISTSRHIRQMAYDIKDLAYDSPQRILRGLSRAVAGDPYQLRIYVPDGFSAKRVELSGGRTAKFKTDDSLLTVDYISTTGEDVEWKVFF